MKPLKAPPDIDSRRFFNMFHTGQSMSPTLAPSDELEVIPYEGRNIKIGDVVVFIPPGADHKVAHRVVSFNLQGVRTKGDNSVKIDQWIIAPSDVIGRVIYARKRERKTRIYGGLAGQLFVIAIRIIRITNSAVSFIFGPYYRWLARTRIFSRIVPCDLEPHAVTFNRSKGKESLLYMGRFVIGRRMPHQAEWHIRRPFRLFVDAKFLSRLNK